MAAIFDDALKQSIRTTRYNLAAMEEFPESFKHGAWKPIEKERAAGHWVDGFWTGLLWLAYAHTGDSSLRAGAEDWTNRLANLKTSTGTQDRGFHLLPVACPCRTSDRRACLVRKRHSSCLHFDQAIHSARVVPAGLGR